MNYNDFKFKAVVDFIDIRVSLQEPSHVSGMRANEKGKGHTGLDWVVAVDKEAGGAATIFDLRIHDPRHYSDVQAVLQRLERLKAFACAPVIRRIEISLDAYPRDLETPPEALAELVVNMTEWHQYPAGDRRIYGRRFREMAFQRKSAATLVSQGCMVGMGHKKSDHYQRAYYKTTDKAGKVDLAPKQRRVRFENNYSAQALPVTTLGDLSTFRFETLASCGFSFRALKDGHGNGIAEEANRTYTLPVGAVTPRRSLTPRGSIVWRNSGRLTEASLPLNEKARQALKNLSTRWARHNATETPPKRQRDATENCNLAPPATGATDKHMSSFSVDFLQKIRYFMRVWGRCPNNLTSIPYVPITRQLCRPALSTTQSRFITLEITRIPEGVREKFFPTVDFEPLKPDTTGRDLKVWRGISLLQKSFPTFKPLNQRWGRFSQKQNSLATCTG